MSDRAEMLPGDSQYHAQHRCKRCGQVCTDANRFHTCLLKASELECGLSDLLVSRTNNTIKLSMTSGNVTMTCKLLRREAKELVQQLRHMIRDE